MAFMYIMEVLTFERSLTYSVQWFLFTFGYFMTIFWGLDFYFFILQKTIYETGFSYALQCENIKNQGLR